MKFIKKYFKFLSYHIISLVDACVNILGALFGIQRVLDLATEWAVFCETVRIDKEMEVREKERKDEAVNEIAKLFMEAKEGLQ